MKKPSVEDVLKNVTCAHLECRNQVIHREHFYDKVRGFCREHTPGGHECGGMCDPKPERTGGMTDLIEALSIFCRYKNLHCPTHCDREMMFIMGVTYTEVTVEDKGRLEALGFTWNEDPCETGDGEGTWCSDRFGSA